MVSDSCHTQFCVSLVFPVLWFPTISPPSHQMSSDSGDTLFLFHLRTCSYHLINQLKFNLKNCFASILSV